MSDPKADAGFVEYADSCLRHHQLLMEGKEASPEIAEIEDRMEELWLQLDEIQRQSLNGISSDLNWIRREGEPPPRGRTSPTEVCLHDQEELSAAMKSKDWHRVLHYLRLCAPAFESASLARERSVAYEFIGLPSYAKLFKAKAIEFAPLTNLSVPYSPIPASRVRP